MIDSLFILDVVNRLIDGDEYELKLKSQIPCLSESKREYTDIGVYIYFNHSPDIVKNKVPTDNVINGIKIVSEEENIESEANLFLKDGLIDYLEIVSFGDYYPKTDPKKYKLFRFWEDN